ncbi:MAG: TetR/AcrR family transcriptional regulator [Saccharospirillaceae bacterium]|nr:TetR/AcrR family transcriptional regulator [Pseudomonadales bacterium]NRB80995.1 TetR/AcrR family transcriptional regulator [Saccharospirillaceae bacterium]
MSDRMIYQTDATRERILTGAEELFVENGFSATQMKDIALSIKMSRNTLYRYYRDKYDLGFAILVKVLTRYVQRYDQIFDDFESGQYSSAIEALQALLIALCNPDEKNSDRFIAEFDGFYTGARVPENFVTQLSQSLPSDPIIRLDKLFVAGQKDGSIRDDKDPHLMSVITFNAVNTFYRRMLLRVDSLLEIKQESIPVLSPMLIDLLIDGLKPQKTKN